MIDQTPTDNPALDKIVSLRFHHRHKNSQDAKDSWGEALAYAQKFGAPTSMGFRLLNSLCESPEQLEAAVKILNGLPRGAVRDLKDQWDSLDRAYNRRAAEIGYAMLDAGVSREVMDVWLNVGVEQTDESLDLQEVMTDFISLTGWNYLQTAQIVWEWYS